MCISVNFLILVNNDSVLQVVQVRTLDLALVPSFFQLPYLLFLYAGTICNPNTLHCLLYLHLKSYHHHLLPVLLWLSLFETETRMIFLRRRLCHSSIHNPSMVYLFTQSETWNLDSVPLWPYHLLPFPLFTSLWSHDLHADLILVRWASAGSLNLMFHLPGCLPARYT